ncbi:unnamed protein product [Urochloa humidicola]
MVPAVQDSRRARLQDHRRPLLLSKIPVGRPLNFVSGRAAFLGEGGFVPIYKGFVGAQGRSCSWTSTTRRAGVALGPSEISVALFVMAARLIQTVLVVKSLMTIDWRE